MEPIQWKGGTLRDLYKGKGAYSVKENFRGILTTDSLGKTVHRARVDDMEPYAQDFLFYSQCCGVEQRGVDFVAMAARLFLNFAKVAKLTTVLFFF